MKILQEENINTKDKINAKLIDSLSHKYSLM